MKMSRAGVVKFLNEVTRFIGFGLINTVFTILLYQFLLFFINPGAAYALSWLVGFAFVVLFYPKIVFRRAGSGWRSAVVVGVIYICNFLIGIYSLQKFSILINSDRLAIFTTLVVTTALNYVSMRLALGKMVKTQD